MERVTIQNTDLKIAPINLGGNVFGWTLDEKASFGILDRFTDADFNFIDTADTYSWWVNGVGGQSEEIIGKWLKSRKKKDVVIATKTGSQTARHGYDISKRHILNASENSLKRLGVERIDLYYTHFDDHTTPVEETLSAYDELIRAGKIRHIAASNLSAERISESLEAAEKNGLPKYVALQPHYNLLERKAFESEYADLAKKHQLAVFPYYALASGFLTGKYRTEADFGKSPRGEGLKNYLDDRGKAVLKTLDNVAEKHRAELATVALAWLLANPLVTAPIASATNERQLQALVAAPELKLDAEDLKALDEAGK